MAALDGALPSATAQQDPGDPCEHHRCPGGVAVVDDHAGESYAMGPWPEADRGSPAASAEGQRP